MKRNSFTYVLVLFAMAGSFGSFAQDYIVTLQGDTIKGEVKPLTYGPEKKVQVTEPGKKRVVYPFFKIKSFTVNGENFQTVKGPNGYAFMKPIKTGYLSLFAFQGENQTAYDAMYLLKKDGTGMEIPNLTFKKGMRKFLEDCPVVAERIDNDILNKRDIDKIIDEYNACIENQPSGTNLVKVAPAQQPTITTPAKNTSAWDKLENTVNAQSDFPEKENALEMIKEIKSKLAASQKIPNFLIEGVKNALNQEVFKADLDAALAQID